MKLLLIGHTERYPVEQLQMQLFPDEPSEFVTQSFTGDGTVSSLSRGKKYLTATAKVTKGGKTGFASRRIPLENADVRMTRRILQQSYYLAATKVLGTAPPWGALSGVRPTKLSTKCMLEGGSEKDAARLLEKTYFVTPERSRLCVDASKHTLEAAKLLEPGDLSVYIGIPFCPTRCSYCSFVSESIERFGAFLPPYLERRCIGRSRIRESCWRIPGITSALYTWGGGTPTTLSSPQMKELLRAINDSFDLSRCLEFTVEGGRPDTLDEEKLRVIHDGGATRISINPQTMADDVLAAVGRKHTAAQTVEAFRQARAVGFEDINMDLIAGLPEDTPEKFADSLSQVLALNPSNVTVHTLALKKGANLFQNRTSLPTNEDVSQMLSGAETSLRAHSFVPYYLYRQKYMSGSFENTGWCRPGFTGWYNIYMMEELHTILSLGGGGMNKIRSPRWAAGALPQSKIPAGLHCAHRYDPASEGRNF